MIKKKSPYVRSRYLFVYISPTVLLKFKIIKQLQTIVKFFNNLKKKNFFNN